MYLFVLLLVCLTSAQGEEGEEVTSKLTIFTVATQKNEGYLRNDNIFLFLFLLKNLYTYGKGDVTILSKEKIIFVRLSCVDSGVGMPNLIWEFKTNTFITQYFYVFYNEVFMYWWCSIEKSLFCKKIRLQMAEPSISKEKLQKFEGRGELSYTIF